MRIIKSCNMMYPQDTSMTDRRSGVCPEGYYNKLKKACTDYPAGHRIATMDDLLELYEKSFSTDTVEAIGIREGLGAPGNSNGKQKQ